MMTAEFSFMLEIPPFCYTMPRMDRIRVYTGGVAACNGYLFRIKDGSYIAVDAPAGFADWIYEKKPDIVITDLLLTHQHFDHVEDACRMRQIFGCRIHAGQAYGSELTLETLARDAWGLQLSVQPYVVDDVVTAETHTADWGGLLWHLHLVPGHSVDSVVYELPDEGLMFTGDVIFAGSIGRTDLPGGNLRLLKSGIEAKVLSVPATTKIFPGHGPYTTVKNELLTNPFI